MSPSAPLTPSASTNTRDRPSGGGSSFPFKPVSKVFGSSSSSSARRDRESPPPGMMMEQRPLHVATPAKTKLQAFFSGASSSSSSSNLGSPAPGSGGSGNRSNSQFVPPPVPAIPAQHLADASASSRPIKIRANVSAEAKVRGSATPVLAKKGSTIRLVGGGGGASATMATRPSFELSRTSMDDRSALSAPYEIVSRGQHNQHGDDNELDDEAILLTQGWVGNGTLEEESAAANVPAAKETVVVTIRVRPLPQQRNNTEGDPASSSMAWTIPQELSPQSGSLVSHSLRLADGSRKEWQFDQVLPPTTTNHTAYLSAALPLIRASMQGFNAVVFAYGQTASGKSHTITGTAAEPGVIPLSVEEIFRIIKRENDREWVLRASYLELYNENLFDLLSAEGTVTATPGGKEGIQLLNGRKDGEVQIQGLTEMVVTNVSEVKRVLALGESRRRTGCTDWNERSSRSHSVFRIVIESRSKGGEQIPASSSSRMGGKASKATRISCLSLIDLAGSEKATASKERNAEGKHINQSLLTLKNVISKLAEQSSTKKAAHIPYRDSKLTRLLQPSLSGDAKISVICTINPSLGAIAESQSTLAFASGIKRVVLSAKQTEVVDPAALIQQYQNEIAELKAKLAARDAQTSMEPTGNRRMTIAESRENDKTSRRLAELKRLILTSTSVEEEEEREREDAETQDKTQIDPERSNYSLQQELHVATTKIDEQQAEIARLKEELELRPRNVDERVDELQREVAQLRVIADDYENNLTEPQQKVREDVEKEWRPRVEALEAKAAEKEKFYRELYDSVQTLRGENARLKTICERLTAEKKQFAEVLRGLEENPSGTIVQPSPWAGKALPAQPAPSPQLLQEHADELENQLPPLASESRIGGRNAPRNTSVSTKHLNSRMTTDVAKRGLGLRSVQEDSMFDLARRAAELDPDEDIF